MGNSPSNEGIHHFTTISPQAFATLPLYSCKNVVPLLQKGVAWVAWAAELANIVSDVREVRVA
jgi:hypothetical protein